MKDSTKVKIILSSAAVFMITTVIVAIGTTLGLQKNDLQSPAFTPSSYKLFSHYAVATQIKVCSQIGKDIIEMNGSVVDSAVASMLCIGVVSSHTNGIGGGHVATIYARPNNGSEKVLTTLIARERAPGNSSETMFANRSSLYGGLAVGIPGEIRGFYEAWKRFGWLPWSELVEPTIRLLEDGYDVERSNAAAIVKNQKLVLNTSLVKSTLLRDTFIPNGSAIKVGDKLKDPTLAKTFRMIANDPESFYKGELAKLIATEIQNEGGIISETDLANYAVEWKEPIAINLNGNKSTLYSLRPPSSGAVLGLILNILKHYNFTPSSNKGDERILTFHRIMEAFRLAYAGRLDLGDESFLNISELVSNMTSEDFALRLWKKINDSATQPVDYYRAMYLPVNDHGTAHLSILHPDGSAVAMTSTINTEFGSLIKGPTTGIIYNNEMDDFSSPNKSNFYGYTPSPSNYIKPGKRPMSSMCPTIILDDQKKVRIISGASGGSRIITTTAWVIINSFWFNLTLGQSIDFPRLHNQLLPNQISYESRTEKEVVDGLINKGHKMTVDDNLIGVTQSIRNWCQTPSDLACIEAASDGRRFGEPFGL